LEISQKKKQEKKHLLVFCFGCNLLYMLDFIKKLKDWWNELQHYKKFFFIVFIPAILFTIYGVSDFYLNYFDLLTKEHHMGFFLRFFFPISLALLVTSLEYRKRKRLIKDIKDYLDK
jgi:hypothetical protein